MSAFFAHVSAMADWKHPISAAERKRMEGLGDGPQVRTPTEGHAAENSGGEEGVRDQAQRGRCSEERRENERQMARLEQPSRRMQEVAKEWDWQYVGPWT